MRLRMVIVMVDKMIMMVMIEMEIALLLMMIFTKGVLLILKP